MMTRRLLPVALAFGAFSGMLLAASDARAGLQLSLEEAGQPALMIQDNGVGDADTTIGSISFTNLTFGHFTLSGSADLSNATTGSGNDDAILDLESLKVKNNLDTGNATNGFNSKTLTISLTDTGFTFPVGAPRTFDGSASVTFSSGAANFGDSFTFLGAANGDNQAFSTTGPQSVSATHSFTSTSMIRSDSYDELKPWLNSTTPFSMTSIVTLTLKGGHSVSSFGGTGDVRAVPEPASFAIIATGLPVLAFGAWRRRRPSKG